MFGFGKHSVSDVIADVASDPVGSALDGARKLADEVVEHPMEAILGGVVLASLFADDEVEIDRIDSPLTTRL